MPQRDHYSVLGVPPNANAGTIENAYRRLALKLHPDAGTEPDAARFREVHDAYHILSDAARRRSSNVEIGRVAPKNSAGMPVLDVILLGLGEDAHTASLMPNAPPQVNHCREAYVAVDNSPKPPPRRISLTYAALAAAKDVWTLVSGAGKEEALRQSLRPGAATPFARVLQSRARNRIFSDIAI